MIIGYTRPLYLLPFDHRASYISGLFGWKEPLNVEQMVTVANSKQVIYAGFEQAIADQVPQEHVGLLVDEEFGSAILRDAASKGYITAVSVEKSGQEEFEFAYGEDFAQHIQAVAPTFAKVLVRYNPEGDVALNQRQVSRLTRLSDSLHQTQRLFLFELLVPATPLHLDQVEGDKHAYDLQLRPRLMLQAIQALKDAGVEPDVEGRRAGCPGRWCQARRDGSAWWTEHRRSHCAGTRCRARPGRALAQDSGERARVHRVCGRAHEFLAAPARCCGQTPLPRGGRHTHCTQF